MLTSRKITLFHAPNSRSTGVLTLLEELGAPYDLKILNLKAGEQRQPPYLAVNPLGKVPAILDGDALITEQVAIFIHLADRFPEAGLAPALDDPQRGPYLRWMVYYAACFEPALIDKHLGHEPETPMMSTYGSYDAMLDALEAQLARGPNLIGDRLSAADILWGNALTWTMMFGLVPKRPLFVELSRRISERPAAKRVDERDERLAAEHEAAVAQQPAEVA